LQILLQDKYNIGVLTVNIEFTVSTPILYIYCIC